MWLFRICQALSNSYNRSLRNNFPSVLCPPPPPPPPPPTPTPGRVAQSWVRYPIWPHTFVSPSADSSGEVVSYWRKYVREVLVNRFGDLSLPRKSAVRLTDRPDMTLDVYRGRKTTTTQQQQQPQQYAPPANFVWGMGVYCFHVFRPGRDTLLFFFYKYLRNAEMNINQFLHTH